MNILSYRGPATAGGVSTALARIIQSSADGNHTWWYLAQTTLESRPNVHATPRQIARLGAETVAGHYSYCNSFLWPILHDLPQYASFSITDRKHYHRFNRGLASIIQARHQALEQFFINDYQLAIMPELLSRTKTHDIIVFWHVPWPRSVPQPYANCLAEIAQGLLGAKRIGFHTSEYSRNFMRFVAESLINYRVDFKNGCVFNKLNPSTVTEIVTLPLGIDVPFWETAATQASPTLKDSDIREKLGSRFILSVDRADYTKGVIERLEAIETFFAEYPDRVGEITFAQVCQQTRMGLPAFDEYWQKCRRRCAEINSGLKTENWQPICWLETPVPLGALAWLYRKADTMLISPVRDGLNLTAKEFAVCSNRGALVLSTGAGVAQELGGQVIPLNSLAPTAMAAQIESALTLPEFERVFRLNRMKEIIKLNNLDSWWTKFAAEPKRSAQPNYLKRAGIAG